jgi:hypothetical protein
MGWTELKINVQALQEFEDDHPGPDRADIPRLLLLEAVDYLTKEQFSRCIRRVEEYLNRSDPKEALKIGD